MQPCIAETAAVTGLVSKKEMVKVVIKKGNKSKPNFTVEVRK